LRYQLSAIDPCSCGEIGLLLVARQCSSPGPPTTYVHIVLNPSEPLGCGNGSKGSRRASPSPHGVASAALPPLPATSLSAVGSGLSSPLLPPLSRSLKDVDSRVQSLQDTCSRLPRESYNNLRCFAGTGLLRPQAITGGSRSLPESVLTAPLPSFSPTGI